MADTSSHFDLEALKTNFEGLLERMMTPSTVEVSESEDSISIQIQKTEDTGLLIGKHGRTIEALSLLANLFVKNQSGEWKRVVVNIADWNEKEEKRLSDLAMSVSERAIETGEPQFLYSLSSSQRRIIHTLLSENEKVETLSEGDGAERYLIVRPR